MSVNVGTAANGVTSASRAGRTRGLRRATLAALVILLVQYGFGMYTNLYATVPAADHGHGLGAVISHGPASLSVHAVLGMLLILAAVGLVVQAALARSWVVLVPAAVALAAIIGAFAQGVSFASGGHAAASMAMAALAGVAVLCYAIALYLLPAPARP